MNGLRQVVIKARNDVNLCNGLASSVFSSERKEKDDLVGKVQGDQSTTGSCYHSSQLCLQFSFVLRRRSRRMDIYRPIMARHGMTIFKTT